MRKVIHKFPLGSFYTQLILDQYDEVLTVQLQDNVPYLWVLINVEGREPRKLRAFVGAFTGEYIQLNPNDELKYIATTQSKSGIVTHYFESTKLLSMYDSNVDKKEITNEQV